MYNLKTLHNVNLDDTNVLKTTDWKIKENLWQKTLFYSCH